MLCQGQGLGLGLGVRLRVGLGLGLGSMLGKLVQLMGLRDEGYTCLYFLLFWMLSV